MFKKFFRKVRDVVKKAAPIAGIAALGMTGLGMLGGGGGGISNLVPSLLGNFAKATGGAGGGPIKGSGPLGFLQSAGKGIMSLGGSLIGPGGKNIKKIIEDTECEVNVDDDGLVTIAGANTEKCNEAMELVKAITFEPEVGMEFDSKVTRLMSFGAFVEFAPGREGMVHISELEWHRVEKVEDVLNPGDKVKVKLIKIDDQGRLDFSRKALIEKPEGYVEQKKSPRHGGGRGGKKPFKKRRF